MTIMLKLPKNEDSAKDLEEIVENKTTNCHTSNAPLLKNKRRRRKRKRATPVTRSGKHDNSDKPRGATTPVIKSARTSNKIIEGSTHSISKAAMDPEPLLSPTNSPLESKSPYPSIEQGATSYHQELLEVAYTPALKTSAYQHESLQASTTLQTSAAPVASTATDPTIEVKNNNPFGKRPWDEEKESGIQSSHDEVISTYSWKNVFTFQHEGETCYCFGFEKDQKLVFIGYALIGALYGSIEINGATISGNTDLPFSHQFSYDMLQYVSFYPVFSARTSGLTVVQSTCYEEVTTSSPSISMNSTFNDLMQLLEPLSERWESFQSIIIVKRLDWCGVDQLEQMVPSLQNMFRLENKIDYCNNDGLFYEDIPGFQPIIDMTPEVKALQHQSSWELGTTRLMEYEQEHAAPAISVICGNKYVNKSAFARYTINRMLKNHYRVAYLETDVEHTGLVTLYVIDSPLLGPSFTHPHLKYKQCFFIGTTASQMDQQYYMECIKQLLSRYRQESTAWAKTAHQDQDESYQLPLVVNTHGWISGQGYNILLTLMEYAKPTHVFGLTVSATGFGHLPFPKCFAHKVMALFPPNLPVNEHLMLLTAETPTSELLTLSHHRQLMFLSYIYHKPGAFACNNNTDDNSWWQVIPSLMYRTPWMANWREQIDGVYVLYDDVPLSQLLYVLHGAVVALVGKIVPLVDKEEDDDVMVIEGKDLEQLQQKSKTQVTDIKIKTNKNQWILPNYYPANTNQAPNPSNTTCFGLGIIRTIDPERQLFHILTPLPGDRLDQVTHLVKGDLELPVICMLDQTQ